MDDLITCRTCRTDYDPADAKAVRQHADSVDCSCGRCSGKPRCYSCGSSFCVCAAH